MSQIGRHYLVKRIELPQDPEDDLLPHYSDYKSINRHYTEAFSMRSLVYESILKLCDNKNSSDAINAIKKEIENHKQENLCLTIKNYSKNSGLSKTIHESVEKSSTTYYQVKGPMGKGLDIPSTGRNIAFTAGTGVLVFIDLVAHLILRLVAHNGGEELEGSSAAIDLDNFTFELYTAFSMEQEAIGIELIKALEKLCRASGYPDLFKHHSAIGGHFFDKLPIDGAASDGQYFRAKITEY